MTDAGTAAQFTSSQLTNHWAPVGWIGPLVPEPGPADNAELEGPSPISLNAVVRTPVDWVDSLVFQSESWDEEEFEGPSSEEYADFIEDAINAVAETLDVPSGTYWSSSQFESAVLAAVAALNPSSSEAASIMAEVAAYGVETGDYWVDNGDDWYEEVCDEEGGGGNIPRQCRRYRTELGLPPEHP